jgi:hypothetical protein
MRRKERQLDLTSAQAILATGEYGVLSTVDKDGQPYGVPVNYVYYDDAIFFHSAGQGHKLANLAENPRVSFCVVAYSLVIPESFSSDYESVIIFGHAAEIFGEDKLEALHAIADRFSPQHQNKGNEMIIRLFNSTTVMKITIDKINGKARREVKEPNPEDSQD